MQEMSDVYAWHIASSHAIPHQQWDQHTSAVCPECKCDFNSTVNKKLIFCSILNTILSVFAQFCQQKYYLEPQQSTKVACCMLFWTNRVNQLFKAPFIKRESRLCVCVYTYYSTCLKNTDTLKIQFKWNRIHKNVNSFKIIIMRLSDTKINV